MAQRASTIEEILALLSQPDPSTKPDADGLRRCIVRGRVPVVLNCEHPALRASQIATDAPAEARAIGDGAEDVIEGIASSTSVDWYETRMTRQCLDSMAAQFRTGVDYLPRHHSYSNTIEWDGIIGRTFEADVVRANVKAPKENESAQEQFALMVRTKLDMAEPLAQKLVTRIRAGNAPGQSIGGWFTEFNVTYDEDGRVVYPINVMGIDLDHLAAVRQPANPDADRVWLALGKALDDAGKAAFGGRTAPAAATPATDAPVPVLSERGSPVPVLPSEPPASAPAGGSAPEARAVEIEMDPKQLEEMIARAVNAAVAQALKPADPVPDTRATPVAPPTPPVPDATAAYWQARAQAAETANAAITAAAAGGPGAARSAAGAGGTPPASGAPNIPEIFRSKTGTDLREIAPNACRVAQRTGSEVEPSIVYERDGFRGLAEYARVQGESNELSDLVIRTEALQQPSFVPHLLRNKPKSELESLLGDVIYAGMRDGLIAKKSATWAA